MLQVPFILRSWVGLFLVSGLTTRTHSMLTAGLLVLVQTFTVYHFQFKLYQQVQHC